MPKNGQDLSSPGKRTDYTNLEEAKLVHIDRRREASTQREMGEMLNLLEDGDPDPKHLE